MNQHQASTFALVTLVNLLFAAFAPITYTFVAGPVFILSTEQRQRKPLFFLLTIGQLMCVLRYPDKLYVVMCALMGFLYSYH